ncbi:MAG TPA: NUDIX domain-containing protein [Bacillota bacterium]|nr:NUDIX domain-containing protein [Bacillota bacterium]
MQPTTALNAIQTDIVRELFLRGNLRFAQMNTNAVPNDHFSYHVRQLIKYGLVERVDNGYRLSTTGKTRAIMLSEHESSFIHQALIALRVVVSNHEHGQEFFLVQERTKVPFKGVLALPGGKVLFAEDVTTAARRTLRYETGLDCSFDMRGIVHYKDEYEGEIVQDKFFFVLRASNPVGSLKANGRTGKNFWMKLDELRTSAQTHQGLLEIIDLASGSGFGFREQTFTTASY